MKKWIFMAFFMVCGLFLVAAVADDEQDEYIKWFDFNVPCEILSKAYEYDKNSQDTEYPLDFIQLLAYTSAKNWGKFNKNSSSAMSNVVARIKAGERMHDIVQDMELYNFYFSAYSAVLGGFVGHYEQDNARQYGLRVFSPLAKGYGFSHSDDFGNPRSYGYSRPHLGHDVFGAIGAPIIAVECGTVEALGWNRFGGWRIGIRSLDQKRYYYYAHLQKNKPYATGLEVGTHVHAGDVIGFLGNTGYSNKENVANLKQPHLHFGIQIIFDEAQKDGNNQIWIDAYHIFRFLNQNRMEVTKNEAGEYTRAIERNVFPME